MTLVSRLALQAIDDLYDESDPTAHQWSIRCMRLIAQLAEEVERDVDAAPNATIKALEQSLAERDKELADARLMLRNALERVAEADHRAGQELRRRQSLEGLISKLTDSMADLTADLAARFGNDNTWDELIDLAVGALDELDPL